ncbi:MAG: cobyrinate a,c-diamide synthase [Thermoleophilia bacterium]
MKRPLIIAGAASGVGKTTIATGIMGALKRRGLKVAPFKVGPDYIDPGYHSRAAGVASRNLDTWLTSPDVVRSIFSKGSEGADVSVVEGVMGLFDGRTGAGNEGSTAEIAGLVDGEVVLVIDCQRQARSLAPVLSGFSSFDPGLKLAGAILNNVGSASHARILRNAAREAGVHVYGVLPRRDDITMPSRHLGLVPAGERNMDGEVLARIIDHVGENVDLDALLSLAAAEDTAAGSSASTRSGSEDQPGPGDAEDSSRSMKKPRVRIAVARDEAFSFYYVDSLEALETAGAELLYFSPLNDGQLPDCDGLYLGGGFPEMFAAELEANATMRASVTAAVREGLPSYAECGGLVYLGREVDIDGERRMMAGAIPLAARMTGRRQALGYVEAAARSDNLLLRAGERVRGHEFHWSAIDWQEDMLAYECFSSSEPGGKADGFSSGHLLASYVHIHFGGNENAAAHFIDACAGVKGAAPSAIG